MYSTVSQGARLLAPWFCNSYFMVYIEPLESLKQHRGLYERQCSHAQHRMCRRLRGYCIGLDDLSIGHSIGNPDDECCTIARTSAAQSPGQVPKFAFASTAKASFGDRRSSPRAWRFRVAIGCLVRPRQAPLDKPHTPINSHRLL